jgi:hypothetical protein
VEETTRLLLERVSAALSDNASDWLALPRPSARIHVEVFSERPRSVMLRGSLGQDVGSPRVMVKIRREQPDTAGRQNRPRLRSGTPSAAELTKLEFDALVRIHDSISASEPGLATVRPLAVLEDINAIVMEYVEQPTLRKVVLAYSRFAGVRTPRRDIDEIWRRSGRWLRVFQAAVPADQPVRQADRGEILGQIGRYQTFLASRVGAATVDPVVTRAQEMVHNHLPEELPLAPGHGDYAPRNMFVFSDDRLAVFDPLPRWRVPEYEDLCRLLIGLRLMGVQLHSHGAAYRASQIETWESAALHGYYGDDVPWDRVRSYQMLILLDKWAALVDTAHRGIRSRVRIASIRLASRYVRSQADRIYALVGCGPG